MIGFKPESREELRLRLREMSDLELRRFGQTARKLADPKMNFGAIDPYVVQLDEARANGEGGIPRRLKWCHSAALESSSGRFDFRRFDDCE